MCAINYQFRPAQPEDVMDIWLLLHAECQNPDLKQIRNQLPQLYVLFKNRTIIGVLCRNSFQETAAIGWMATHPLYPTQMVKELMMQSFADRFQTRSKTPVIPPQLKPSLG